MNTTSSCRVGLAALAVTVLPAFALMVDAQPGSESKEPRLVIHGYLTQAYANSAEHQLLGIPNDGTFDYRRVALLFRGQLSSNDTLVLQLAQRRLGESPAMQVEADVKVDWAFYEHRFPHGTTVRAGRISSPQGIYSEIRYAGTLLPFYRVPFNVYQEGSYTSETIDGLRLTQTLFASKPWNLELHVYGGGFSSTEAYAGKINQGVTSNARGGQLWLNTPVEGLRLGAGRVAYDLRKSLFGDQQWTNDIASFDFSRPRYRLQAEYRHLVLSGGFNQHAYYVHGGVNLTEKLSLNLLFDDTRSASKQNGVVTSRSDHLYEDKVVGVNYAFRTDVIAKAEYHHARGRFIEDQAVEVSAGIFDGPYFLLSVSASF